jgi:hypothetical protein
MLKRSILIALINLISFEFIGAQPANAECTTKTCISVYIEDGKIVIDAKRNGATSTPKPRIAPTKAPVVRKPVAPRPTYKPTYTPTYKPTYKPRTSKPAARRTSPSLADKILQSLPTLQVAYQPEGTVLPKVPVIFFTDLPKDFQKGFKILGESVKIDVKPRSLWNFGDGFVLVTSKPGAPYPSRDITHSYSVPGTYLVSVSTFWSGTFTVAGVTTEIPGKIEQNSYVEVKVVGAGTKFVGK